MVLKELADLGFVFAFRFYGRYPETGPRFYHPPSVEADAAAAEAAAENGRGRAPVKRPGLAMATSLILPSLPTADFPEHFLSGTLQNFGRVYSDGCLPSPAPRSVVLYVHISHIKLDSIMKRGAAHPFVSRRPSHL